MKRPRRLILKGDGFVSPFAETVEEDAHDGADAPGDEEGVVDHVLVAKWHGF